MKLLSKTSVQQKIQKRNDDLIETNLRLRKIERDITTRLNNVKEDYEPDKMQRLKEFETFCKNLIEKKGKLLQELTFIEAEIERKKDIYYGLIVKQDALEEREHLINQREININLREVFVEDLEHKWKEKQLTT